MTLNQSDSNKVNNHWEMLASRWTPPPHWPTITTIDAHTEGEPLRVIVSGFPELAGKHILERRRMAQGDFDQYRKILMWEPRGHADMYGCIITPPNETESDRGDFGVLFLHNEGFSSMCGHGIIAVTKIVYETGLVDSMQTTIKIDAPAGRIVATANLTNDQVKSVSFDNVPSFAVELDQTIHVAGIGTVEYDLAFGGAYYAYVDATKLNLELNANNATALIDVGMRIKNAIASLDSIIHPTHSDLSFLYGTIFVGPAHESGNHSRNVCIFADGEVDRSPTGTGVSGRAAIHFARNEIELGEEIRIESILGTTFDVAAMDIANHGTHNGIIPRVTGSAFITGRHQFVVDPDDPLKTGFMIR